MANYSPKTDHLKKTQWTKGQSGNPAGKPRGEHMATRMKRFLEITQVIRNPITGSEEEMTIYEQMALAVIMKARAGDLKAYQTVLNIVEGKPGRAKAPASKKAIGKPLLSNVLAATPDNEPRYKESAPEPAESQSSRQPMRQKSEIDIDKSGTKSHPLSW